MQKNHITLAGYLGSAIEVRYLPSGTPVANVKIAESYSYRDQQQQEVRHTNWHSLVFYGPLALVAKTYEKGDNIVVDGALQIRQFEGKDRSKRTVYEVVVRTCHLIAPPRKGSPEAVADMNDPTRPQSEVPVPEEVNNHDEFWTGAHS